MKIEEVTQKTDIAESIAVIRKTARELDVEVLKAQYSVKSHETMNPAVRKKKTIKKAENSSSLVEVNRLAFPLQKRIVNSSVSFTFGSPVLLECEAKSEQEKLVLHAVARVLFDNKSGSLNRRMARNLFRSTEVAECWFPVPVGASEDSTHETYGFKSSVKLRCKLFSPWLGDKLMPVFSAIGDMIAFGREYSREDDGKKTIYFEAYTDDETVVWVQKGQLWSEASRTPNAGSKIPIVYASQEEPEWADVQYSIERLETLLSNFADTNDYHASPKIFIEGKITGFSQKGETGAILQGDIGTKASYLSWDHAPESIKLEIETLLRFIYSFSQTPDISFESVKGLGQISGEALKMLFIDAHLKVQEKREVLDEYLQRRVNLLLNFIGVIDPSLKKVTDNLEIVPEIVPFVINDAKNLIDRMVSANGGKPILSQRTSIAVSGLVEDVDAEYKLILEEQANDNLFDVTQSTF